MNSHSDKSQENNSQSVANQVSQKKSGSETAFQFVDNRPEAIAQRKLQEMANNSPQVKQLQAIQTMADNSPQAKKAAQLQDIANNYPAPTIQKKEIEEEELLQGKFDTVQTGGRRRGITIEGGASSKERKQHRFTR